MFDRLLAKIRVLTWKQITAIVLVLICLLAARPRPWSLAVGLALILPGAGIRLWACGFLKKNEALAVVGPYAYLRDPLYLGTVLIGTGLCVSGRVWPLLAVFWAGFFFYYLPYKRKREGDRLEQLFGETYRRYRAAVPSLLPRLRRYPLAEQGHWSLRQVFKNSEFGTTVWTLIAFLWLLILALWRGGKPLLF